MKRLFIILFLVSVLLLVYGKFKKSSPFVPEPPSPSSGQSSTQPEARSIAPSLDTAAQGKPIVSKLEKIKEIATEEGLHVLDAQEDPPGTVTISLVAADRTLHNYFLDELQRNVNMIDFDGSKANFSYTPQGRPQVTVTYKIKYR